MPSIFISHSSQDGKEADDIKSALAGMGFERVFLDFDKDTGIGAGEDWEKRLYQELSRCHAVLLVLTPNWLASTWCRIELAQARALGKVIVPVICAPLGERYVLPEMQAVDLVDWNAGGLDRIAQRLHAITDELARGFTLDPRRPPYPGIHAFEAEDAAIFFGRDDETRAVIERLDARRTMGGARLVLVIGASGAGKSSLLKAGVLPQLGRRRDQWVVLPTMRPEKAPLEALAKILAETQEQPRAWRDWLAKLRGPNAAGEVGEFAKDMRVGVARPATLLLPIDQLEELFTISEAGERDAFLLLLASLLDPAQGLPIVAVATGRADVLQGLLEQSGLAPITEPVPLLPMPLDRVPRLIDGPATVASLIVEPGLAQRIARDVENPEALPLLAQTLRLLHDRCVGDKHLTLTAYEALGDVAGGLNPVQNSVRLAADQALAIVKPNAAELAALRDTFVPHLVRLRLDDGRRVRQPARFADLPREAERQVRALTDARVLTARTDNGAVIVEVAHEAMFAAWPTLAGWLDEEQHFLADIERIKRAYDSWAEASERDKPQALLQGLLLHNARDWIVKHPRRFAGHEMEGQRAFIIASGNAADAAAARAQRLRRIVSGTVTAAAVIFLIAAVVSGWQYLRAEAARARAQENFVSAVQAIEGLDTLIWNINQGIQNVVGMRLETTRRTLEQVRKTVDSLMAGSPDNLDLMGVRAAMLANLVDAYLQAGAFTEAQSVAEEGLGVSRAMSALRPDDPRALTNLARSLYKHGDLQDAANDPSGRIADCEAAVGTAQKLVALVPDDAASQRVLWVSTQKLGEAQLAGGSKKTSLITLSDAVMLASSLIGKDTSTTEARRDLAISLISRGKAKAASGDQDGALSDYAESLHLRRDLARENPGNPIFARDLVLILTEIGVSKSVNSDTQAALVSLNEALDIARKTMKADASNARAQRDVAVVLVAIGDVNVEFDKVAARRAYDESLTVLRALVATDTDNIGARLDLARLLAKIALAFTDATLDANESLELFKKLQEQRRLTPRQVSDFELLRLALQAH